MPRSVRAAFFGANGRFSTEHSFDPDKRYRIVLVWSTRGEYALQNHEPDTNLDLCLFDDNGNLVAESTSYDNTYEIIDFVPTETMASAEVRVRRYRSDSDSIKMALSVGEVN